MFFFNKFKINLSKTLFKPNRKNLFIIIRKSPSEYDFIAYILNQLSNQFNIFIIFNNSKSYSLLKSNKFLFDNFKKICFGYVINPQYRYLQSRIILKILKILKINSNKNELDLNKKYYNLNELKKEIYKKIGQNNKKFFLKNDVLFCSFENKSGWLQEFNNDNNKIIYFPEKTNLINSTNQKSKTQISNKKILALFPNKDFYQNYKNKIKFKEYIYCGFPKFNPHWVKLFVNKKIKKIRFKATIFYKTLETKIAYDEKKYFAQLHILLSILKKYQFSINFNLHPLAKKGFEKYFDHKELRNFTISKNNIAQDISDSDLLICKYGTNSILDCVAFNKFPIELWSLKYKKFFVPSIYQEKKISLRCDNSNQLEKYIKNYFNKKKYPMIENQSKKYFFSEIQTKNMIKKIVKFIKS